MPRITEKGITTPPTGINKRDPEIFSWLSKLQLVFPKISTYLESINLTAVGANSFSTQTFTVSGLTMEDTIVVNPPTLTAGLYLITYRVSADDTLSLTFQNTTGGSINEAAADYKVMACRI